MLRIKFLVEIYFDVGSTILTKWYYLFCFLYHIKKILSHNTLLVSDNINSQNLWLRIFGKCSFDIDID